jgi:hypothetical protein
VLKAKKWLFSDLVPVLEGKKLNLYSSNIYNLPLVPVQKSVFGSRSKISFLGLKNFKKFVGCMWYLVYLKKKIKNR